MLDSIYHMTLKILKNCIFGVKTSRFSLILRKVIMNFIMFPENLFINFIAWLYITPRRGVVINGEY